MKTILAACATALFFAVVACSKDDDKKATPVPTATSAAPTTLTLPASYSAGSPSCAACHGENGDGQGSAPGIAAQVKGNYSSVPGFIAIVRSGKGTMPGIPATTISDAELTKIHAYFKQ